MGANSKQHGGDHYKGAAYEHWDLAYDLKLPYLPGVASKYIVRWRKKNGVEDLNKCIHYIEKIIEVKQNLLPVPEWDTHELWKKFCKAHDLAVVDAEILRLILEGEWGAALEAALALRSRTPPRRTA